MISLTDEILWLEVYTRKFPSNKSPEMLYPAVWFALWHMAPQSVLPNQMPVGVASFLFYALLLGLDRGFLSWKTGSIKCIAAAHCIHDRLALSGFTFLQSS